MIVMSTRSIPNAVPLRFPSEVASWSEAHNAVHFVGSAGPIAVDCYVTRDVLERFESAPLDPSACVQTFRRHRTAIQDMAARQHWSYGLNPQRNITVTLADL